MQQKITRNVHIFWPRKLNTLGLLLTKTEYIWISIKTIIELPDPNDLKQLQNFFCGDNYYSKFTSKMTEIAKPLYCFIEKKKGTK